FLSGAPRTIAEFSRRVLVYSAAVFLVVGMLFLAMAALGSFEQMIYWSVEIPRRYVSRIKWNDGKIYLKYTYQAITGEYKFFWMHAAAAVLTLLLRSVSLQLKSVIILLLVFSSLTIFPGF